jgi:hypothetical protein
MARQQRPEELLPPQIECESKIANVPSLTA